MPRIDQLQAITHPGLPGVQLFPLSGEARAGTPQGVLVKMAAGATIPLHSHAVDARMMIVAGTARVLALDDTHGTLVGLGDVVFFERLAPHGFEAGPEGMSFISENGGIVDERSPARWDMAFTH